MLSNTSITSRHFDIRTNNFSHPICRPILTIIDVELQFQYYLLFIIIHEVNKWKHESMKMTRTSTQEFLFWCFI